MENEQPRDWRPLLKKRVRIEVIGTVEETWHNGTAVQINIENGKRRLYCIGVFHEGHATLVREEPAR